MNMVISALYKLIVILERWRAAPRQQWRKRVQQNASFRFCYLPRFDKYFRCPEEKFQFAALHSRRPEVDE